MTGDNVNDDLELSLLAHVGVAVSRGEDDASGGLNAELDTSGDETLVVVAVKDVAQLLFGLGEGLAGLDADGDHSKDHDEGEGEEDDGRDGEPVDRVGVIGVGDEVHGGTNHGDEEEENGNAEAHHEDLGDFLGWLGTLEDDLVGGLDDVMVLLGRDIVLKEDGVVLREVILDSVPEAPTLEGKKKSERKKKDVKRQVRGRQTILKARLLISTRKGAGPW